MKKRYKYKIIAKDLGKRVDQMMMQITQMRFLTLSTQFGIFLLAAVIGGAILSVKKGGEEGLWFVIPILSLAVLNAIFNFGAIFWVILLIILYFYVKPENGKWSDSGKSYWFNMGTLTAILVMFASSFVAYLLV